jgi:3-deoxy-D-arabino-heptulosonate 7-phosphate (DAHP) synthase class II
MRADLEGACLSRSIAWKPELTHLSPQELCHAHEILRRCGQRLHGIHVEMTGDLVAECTASFTEDSGAGPWR